jgi:hypothetical protein
MRFAARGMLVLSCSIAPVGKAQPHAACRVAELLTLPLLSVDTNIVRVQQFLQWHANIVKFGLLDFGCRTNKDTKRCTGCKTGFDLSKLVYLRPAMHLVCPDAVQVERYISSLLQQAGDAACIRFPGMPPTHMQHRQLSSNPNQMLWAHFLCNSCHAQWYCAVPSTSTAEAHADIAST